MCVCICVCVCEGDPIYESGPLRTPGVCVLFVCFVYCFCLLFLHVLVILKALRLLRRRKICLNILDTTRGNHSCPLKASIPAHQRSPGLIIHFSLYFDSVPTENIRKIE